MRIVIVDTCDPTYADRLAEEIARRYGMRVVKTSKHREIMESCGGDALCAAIEYLYRVLGARNIVAVSMLPGLYASTTGEVKTSIGLLMDEEAEKSRVYVLCAPDEAKTRLVEHGAVPVRDRMGAKERIENDVKKMMVYA